MLYDSCPQASQNSSDNVFQTTPVGPGPNYFSDSTTNVWTDTNGWLHLRITHRANAWQCASIQEGSWWFSNASAYV